MFSMYIHMNKNYGDYYFDNDIEMYRLKNLSDFKDISLSKIYINVEINKID